MYDILDNAVLLIGLIAVAYIIYKKIFYIQEHDVCPDELATAYFLLKRTKR